MGMQDIIPPRKSIRDIPLPEDRQRRVAEIEKEVRKERVKDSEPPKGSSSESNNYPTRKSRKGWWIFLLALIIGGLAAFFLFYSKASLAIVTKSQQIQINLQATSTKDGIEGTVPYSIVTLQRDGSVELNGTLSTKQVERKASGIITIYNNYSSSTQQLVATTRFQTPDRLVYRIDKDISVPGQSVQNGQTVPGSIDATVYADQPGPKYNIGKVDFTIPGFQGTSKYATFSAKSKTDMTGGFIGNENVISDSELKSKGGELNVSINQALVEQAQNETPDTFVFFPTSLAIQYATSTEVKEGKTYLTVKAVAIAPIFSKKILTDFVNRSNNTNYSSLEGWEQLEANIGNTKGLPTGDFPSLSLSLQGNLHTGQEINIGELQRNLAGKSKSDLNKILSEYPSVVSANATVSPFWKTHFPSNAKRINITITDESS